VRKSIVGYAGGAGFARATSGRGVGCARGADPFRRELSAVAGVSADSTGGRGARFARFVRIAAGRRHYSAAGLSDSGRRATVSSLDAPRHSSGTWIGHVARYRTVVFGCCFCGGFDAQSLSVRRAIRWRADEPGGPLLQRAVLLRGAKAFLRGFQMADRGRHVVFFEAARDGSPDFVVASGGQRDGARAGSA
jgi:hypothetical protein